MRALIIEPAGAGGIWHYTLALANGLAKRGVECELLTSTRCPEQEWPENLNVHRVFRGRWTNIFALWWKCFLLRKRVDIVHWQSASHPKLLYRLMRVLPLKSKPWVYTVHNVLPHERSSEDLEDYRLIYSRMNGLIFHAHFSESEFKKLFSEVAAKRAIIPHGEYAFLSQHRRPLQVKEDENTILFFGNIRPYKGLDALLQAFAIVRNEWPQARLKIVGQALQPFGPYEEIIELLRLKESVEIRLGYVPDEEIPAIVGSARVMALPYRSIDQSGALLLAMGAGKTVVTTCVGGIPEVLRHEKTGILVPPDDPPALAKALLGCLRDPARAREIGKAARHDALTRFSWDSIAIRTLEYYREVGQV